MTLQRIESGLIFPTAFVGNPWLQLVGNGAAAVIVAAGTMDAAAEKVAFIGRVQWEGGPASAKTMGSTSKIHFLTGAVTFADAATNLRIGLQDIQTSGVTVVQPDGTFDVYADIAGNSGTITSSDDDVVKSITLSTSGSKDVSHGQFVAVVFDMTARGGSDSVVINGLQSASYLVSPSATRYVTSWAINTASVGPLCVLEANDGTFGVLYGACGLISGSGRHLFQASSTPDEYGLIFQVNFRCAISALIGCIQGGGATGADSTLTLYSDPLGTPTAMWSENLLGEQGVGTSTRDRLYAVMTGADITLEPNTDYCIALAATGASTVNLNYVTLADADHRNAMGLANCRQGSRADGSGAFSETTTTIPFLGIGISAIDDGVGSGRASLNIGV